jgi:hypothetical protein
MLENIPVGLDQIIKTFGSLDTPGFEQKYIVSITPPYPVRYDGQVVKTMRCHKLAADNFMSAFEEIKRNGLIQYANDYSGIYNRRPIKNRPSHPSTHSWGIAIDLEAADFPLGSKKRINQGVIDAFQKYGFFYGGDFVSRKDPMHFQLATHY